MNDLPENPSRAVAVPEPLPPSCTVRVYAELNDCLPSGLRHHSFPCVLGEGDTVDALARELAIPRESIDLVLLNGCSVDWAKRVMDGDRVSFYPVFESFDISSVVAIRPAPLRNVRFVLDVHLGKLAYYLRMLGFDSSYRNDFNGEELVRCSVEEGRVLLSKDRELLADERIVRGYRVRNKHPYEQLCEVLTRFDLFTLCKPLQRCIRCNILLQPVEKRAVLDRLPPRVADAFEEYRTCLSCGRVYWKGSHYERMQEVVRAILQSRTTG